MNLALSRRKKRFLSDSRLKLLEDEFFVYVASSVHARYNAILIDVDDSPNVLWHNIHAAFYGSTGIEAIQAHLTTGCVLALWCAFRPSEDFVELVRANFATTELVEVHFENPCLRQPETNYILLATMPM